MPTKQIYVPAEEEPHQATFMQWPVSMGVYKDKAYLRMVQGTIANIANAISEFETVYMLAARSEHVRASKKLSKNVELWNIPTDDLWCRDSGPIFSRNMAGDLTVLELQFNGWGNKQDLKRDALIARRVAERLGLPFVPTGLIGEGGGVEQNGHGLLLAHESSWVNDNRNPSLSREQIEKRLLKAYGASAMIWSKGVVGEDITDYHVDALARFTGPNRVLINLAGNYNSLDSYHIAARQTHDALIASGLDIDVIPEPSKPRIKSADFVASYANYYVCNGGVIAPEFGDARADKIAVDVLQRHYPSREVVTLNIDLLGELGGGVHCATQQMPAV